MNAEREAPRGILQALERSVVRPSRLHETSAGATERLVVVRGDRGAGLDDGREPRAGLHVHTMFGERSRDLLVLVVAHLFGEVLDEVSPARDVQQLDATTHRERRQITLERRAQKGHLARVASRLGLVRLGMRVGPVQRRIDIRAA